MKTETPELNDLRRITGTERPPSRSRISPAGRALLALLATCLVALVVVACGGNLTAGGFGEVEVTVSGDAPDADQGSVWPSEAPGLLSTGPAPSSHDDEPEGKLEIEFLLYLIRGDGSLVEVDDKEIEVELDLAGFFEADAVTAILPADRYVGIRIQFTEIEVEVERGVIINGIPITGPVEVELEDDETITIERPLDVVLEEGGRVQILLDMNARVWLAAMDPDLQRVAERVFSDAIRVVVR
jgi:hypothetical protein